MRRPLTPRQIEVFHTTIKAGTVSRAAERLGVSQPAASKILVNMEQDSGLVLFERVRGRLMPTPAAMHLYGEIEKLYTGMAGIEQAISALHRDDRQELHIGVIPALSEFMSEAVLRFHRRFPDVMMTVEERPSEYLAEWINNRRVDLAMTSLKVDLPAMRTQSLIRRDLLCAMAKGHHLANQEFITAEHFRGEKVLTYATDNLTRQAMETFLQSAGVTPQVVMRATTAPLICRLVAGGAGIAIVHPLGVGRARADLELRPIRPVMKAAYQLCWHNDSRKLRLVEAFSEDIVALARSF